MQGGKYFLTTLCLKIEHSCCSELVSPGLAFKPISRCSDIYAVVDLAAAASIGLLPIKPISRCCDIHDIASLAAAAGNNLFY